jgi:hypothetical protein
MPLQALLELQNAAHHSIAGKPSNVDIKKQCCGETATHMAETFSFQGKDGASQVIRKSKLSPAPLNVNVM